MSIGGRVISMDYIRKLPFILSVAAAIVTGVIGLMMNYSQNGILLRMCIGMTVFLILGIYARSVLTGIYNEIENKRKAEEEEIAGQRSIEENVQMKDSVSTIDFVVGDDESDDFTPMDFSKAIRTELSKD